MPAFELVPGRRIGTNCPCFIIAEIGQNHQGDIQIAKKLIKTAQECGADCVKFQKSNLHEKFAKSALLRPYNTSNSFGYTYGEHKAFLEFTEEEFIELKTYADSLEIIFAASGGDEESIEFLNSINVPFFKIGSGDGCNMRLLLYTANLGKPMIVSTGMQDMANVRKIYCNLLSINRALCLLQCTSSYPTVPENVNLGTIKTYQDCFPEVVVGYSGHETGTGISIAAVAVGAKVLERHFTLDHTMKGNDHVASLEPKEFKHLVTEIRRVEQALNTVDKKMLDCEKACFKKLGKTVVSSRYLEVGTILEADMVKFKVADPKGWKCEYVSLLYGKTLAHSVDEDCIITADHVL